MLFRSEITMKKILSIVLSLAMMFSLAVPAFAAEVETTNSEPMYIENGVYVSENMTKEELQKYNALIDEQVDLIAAEYGNVSREWIRNEIVAALEDPNFAVDESSDRVQTRAGTIIPDINIANNIVAAAINVAIGMVVGGGIAGISAYVKKMGVQEAKKIFSKTIATRLKAWGLTNLSRILPVATTFVLSVLDPGTAIAEYIDNHDVKPGNGQVNFIL